MLWIAELPTLLFTLTLVVYLGVVTGEWSTRAMHDHSPLLGRAGRVLDILAKAGVCGRSKVDLLRVIVD